MATKTSPDLDMERVVDQLLSEEPEVELGMANEQLSIDIDVELGLANAYDPNGSPAGAPKNPGGNHGGGPCSKGCPRRRAPVPYRRRAPPVPTTTTTTPVPPPPDAGYVMVPCNEHDLHQEWTSTGENQVKHNFAYDRNRMWFLGTLQPAFDETLCLTFKQAPELALVPCTSKDSVKWLWDKRWDEITIASESPLPCLAKTNGDMCHLCLHQSQGKVGVHDCQNGTGMAYGGPTPIQEQAWGTRHQGSSVTLPFALTDHDGACFGAYVPTPTPPPPSPTHLASSVATPVPVDHPTTTSSAAVTNKKTNNKTKKNNISSVV